MSAKNNDNHNRFRSRTIAFRVSPEEDERINIAVSLSGMTKQDYITYKLLDRTINVKASCKVHRAVYDRLTEVLEQSMDWIHRVLQRSGIRFRDFGKNGI